jgi:hypothetical protein
MGSAPPLKPCVHPIMQDSIAVGSVNANQRVEATGVIPAFRKWDIPEPYALALYGPSGTMVLTGRGTLPMFVPDSIKGWLVKVSSDLHLLPKVCTDEICFHADGDLAINMPLVHLDVPAGFKVEVAYRWTVGPGHVVYSTGQHVIGWCIFRQCPISHISVRRV